MLVADDAVVLAGEAAAHQAGPEVLPDLADVAVERVAVASPAAGPDDHDIARLGVEHVNGAEFRLRVAAGVKEGPGPG